MEMSGEVKECVASFEDNTVALLPKLVQRGQDWKGLGGKIDCASSIEHLIVKVDGQAM